MLYKIATVLVLTTLWLSDALSAPLVLEDRPQGQRTEGYLSVLRDPGGRLDFDQIRERPFTPLAGQAGFGFTRDVIWLKLDVHEHAGALKPGDGHWWLEVALPSLDDLRLYVPETDGRYRMTRSGDHQPFAERPLAHRLFLFPLELPGPGTYSLYLRVATGDSLAVPVRLWGPQSLRERMAHENLWLGISYGLILGMLIYNAVLWSVLRDSLYGVYVLAGLTSLVVILELNGHAYQYLWPTNLWLADYQHVLMPALHFIALSWWARRFLDMPGQTPWLDLALRGIMLAALGMIALAIAGQYTLGNQLAFWVGTTMTLLVFVATLRVLWRGYRPARLFLLAQFAPLAGALVTLARALGIAPDALWTEHAFQMGVSLEVMLFSLALAQRIELLRQEKQQAQQRAETDPLTGLFNRDGLSRRVEELRDRQIPHALMVVDLDRFKPVNDQLGHEAGDAVLIAVAERMQALVRAEGDIVARIGGDEFVLVLRGVTQPTDAGAVASKLLTSLAAAIPTPAGEARIGASIGIALAPRDGHHFARLLQVADQAMYRSKQDGRNRWYYGGDRHGHPVEPPAAG
ncbi:diguanylate cyclase [Allochromatium humboldtianum]|uniref:diguanylate cyclase n=1 Tax=Allochromatium humboldtianum TaxID=504901 RepID=UPI0031B5F076